MASAKGAAPTWSNSPVRAQNWVASVSVPIGDSISVAVSSVVMPMATSAMPAAMPGAASRSVVPNAALSGGSPERDGGLLELDRHLREAGAHRDDGARQEEQHIGDEQRRDRLVERQGDADGDRDQRQRDDDAGQRADIEMDALERALQPAGRARRHPGDRKRGEADEDRAEHGIERRLAERGAERRPVPGIGAADPEPADERRPAAGRPRALSSRPAAASRAARSAPSRASGASARRRRRRGHSGGRRAATPRARAGRSRRRRARCP